MASHTQVYLKPGVTLYLPGGVHGFTAATAPARGIPLRSDHADALVAVGHLDTSETRAAAIKAAVKADAEGAEQAPAKVDEAETTAGQSAPAPSAA